MASRKTDKALTEKLLTQQNSKPRELKAPTLKVEAKVSLKSKSTDTVKTVYSKTKKNTTPIPVVKQRVRYAGEPGFSSFGCKG